MYMYRYGVVKQRRRGAPVCAWLLVAAAAMADKEAKKKQSVLDMSKPAPLVSRVPWLWYSPRRPGRREPA